MWCLLCGRPWQGSECDRCRASFQRAPDRRIGALLVVASWVHTGGARALVHDMKYRGSRRAARRLALDMAERLDGMGEVAALVPVPRHPLRRWRYGVDQGSLLASFVAELNGLPVVDVLIPPPMGPRHAGAGRERRRRPRFRLSGAVPRGSVLVDDVVTTGATAGGAARASGIGTVVCATTVLRMTSLQASHESGGT